VPAGAEVHYVERAELVCGPCANDVPSGRPTVGLGGLVFDANGQIVKRFPSTVPAEPARGRSSQRAATSTVAFFDQNRELSDDEALDRLLDLLSG
jgi:hypothetical protein